MVICFKNNMFKNTTMHMLGQSILVLIFADTNSMVQCLITWGPIDLKWVKIHFIMLCRRYNDVVTVFNHLSPLTLRLCITYYRHSTVFSLTTTRERLENLSRKLHHVYFGRSRMTSCAVWHIPILYTECDVTTLKSPLYYDSLLTQNLRFGPT